MNPTANNKLLGNETKRRERKDEELTSDDADAKADATTNAETEGRT